MTADPGQTRNVASAHGLVVSELTTRYEQWWKSLEPNFQRHAWIVIGSDRENPTTLTCHDWHSDVVPWNQRAVRSMPGANGYWMIEVERNGRYHFTLRHQPEKANYQLRPGLARIQVGEVEAKRDIPKDATSVTQTVELKTGRARLQTWLIDGITGDQRGAFFVEVRRTD